LPIHDADGRFLGYRGTGTNVTATKLAEQRVEEAQRFLHRAIEALPIGFALFDAEDRLRLVNDTYCRILELGDDVLLEPFWLEITHNRHD